MSYRAETVSYQKIRIVCDRCGVKARCGSNGWATSTVGADDRAAHAGWYVAPLTAHSDLVAGGPHYCPSCAEKYGDRALTCRYDNSCDDSGREPSCVPCAFRRAIGQKEADRG